MPTFGKTSSERLDTCHPDLERLFRRVVQDMDCAVLCGWRSREEQARLYEAGKSHVLKSKHNNTFITDGGTKIPLSLAVDVAPYPIDWGKTPKKILLDHLDTRMDAKMIATVDRLMARSQKAIARFYLLAGIVIAHADIMQIPIRWGGDWDGDMDIFDQSFDDLVHWELVL